MVAMTGQLCLGCCFFQQNSVSPTEPSCKVAEVGRLWWRAVCGSDLEYGGIVASLGFFYCRLADCCAEGENGVRKWVRNSRFCPPHVSAEASLPTAATDSLRACVVEHGFLVETKVLASCPSLESGSFTVIC